MEIVRFSADHNMAFNSVGAFAILHAVAGLASFGFDFSSFGYNARAFDEHHHSMNTPNNLI